MRTALQPSSVVTSTIERASIDHERRSPSNAFPEPIGAELDDDDANDDADDDGDGDGEQIEIADDDGELAVELAAANTASDHDAEVVD